MGGGTIAGIVVPILLLLILAPVLYLFLKKKKKRYNQGGRERAAVYCEYNVLHSSANGDFFRYSR